MLVIIYLLEDEQELSLGMLIRPKRIYNFCLLHACFVWYCYDLDTLSYTFDHIWTNLLTQCTPVPVPVFCCFSISVFPHIKSAPKIREKSAQKNLPEEPEWGQRATTRGPGALVARPRGWSCQGGRLDPWWTPWCPTLAPIYSPVAETLIPDPFSPEAIPISAAIAIKFRGGRIPVLAPYRDKEVPPDSSPSTLLPPSMKRE